MMVMKRFLKIFSLTILSISVVITVFLVFLSIESTSYNSIDKTFGEKLTKVAVQNARIFDPETGILSNEKTVFINHGYISKISESDSEISNKYRIIDAKNKVLMHGLADMHTHIFDRAELIQYLSYGVTHVRNMMGFPTHLTWRSEVENNQLSGSRLITAGPTLNGTQNTSPLHHNMESSKEAYEIVGKIKNEGYDFIKVYDGLSQEQIEAISTSATENSITFSGHPIKGVSNQFILNSGYTTLEHVEELFQSMLDYELDSLRAQELVKELKEADIPVTITLSAYNHLYRTALEKEAFLETLPTEQISPFLRYLGARSLEGWINPTQSGYDWTMKKYAFMEYLVHLLDEEGVPILLGTDTGPNLTVPGWSVLEEIALMQDLGISNLKIIQSGTTEAVDILNHRSFTGTIKEGAMANILFLDQNPLEDMETLSLPNGLILEGVYYDQPTLLEMREYANTHFAPFLISVGQFINYIFN
tara:strand:- start:1145 stop:2572 length:1428 start_codon:yes stop_codon:yes gene_type:complete